jgi:thymidylate synthase (FAD)
MKVDYIEHMGGDITVVNSARVSFDKDSLDSNMGLTKLKEKDKKLIKFLAKHDHFTPFTHSMVTLKERVPIFVARQRFKHVIGFTYNEVSRRYVSDMPDFHVPSKWRYRPENIKQGSSTTEFISSFKDSVGTVATVDSSIDKAYIMHIIESKHLYEKMINSGVCPEQARMILPQSMMTEYYVTGSLYAWARAFNLRKKPTAQLEIQELSTHWGRIVGDLFPVSWEALTNEGE